MSHASDCLAFDSDSLARFRMLELRGAAFALELRNFGTVAVDPKVIVVVVVVVALLVVFAAFDSCHMMLKFPMMKVECCSLLRLGNSIGTHLEKMTKNKMNSPPRCMA